MFVSRVLSRVSTAVGRRALFVNAPAKNKFGVLPKQFYDESRSTIATEVSLSNHWMLRSSASQSFVFSSSASPEPNEKDHGRPRENNNDEGSGEENVASHANEGDNNSDSQTSVSGSSRRRRRGAKRTAFSDSDSESADDLTRDDLVKLVVEKEELVKIKNQEIEQMKDKVLRAYAEMENVMDRTKREAENSKKFAIQNFAKGLLDVADNLGRASSVVKDNFSKIDVSEDASGAVPLLKTLLEGVEMTEKQLAEVFKKFGIEKFDPTNEPFDPNLHNAVFQIPDASKPAGTIAHVLKSGYTLHDRVIRPAEVGVTQAVENE